VRSGPAPIPLQGAPAVAMTVSWAPRHHRPMNDDTHNARLDVIAAAVRAIASTLGPEQAAAATSAFRRELKPIAARPLPSKADQAASAEVAAVLAALGR
jgi:hypothetical protein